MKKSLILTAVIFILSHLVSIYIMGGFYNQTIDSKIYASIMGIFIGGIVSITTYGDNL